MKKAEFITHINNLRKSNKDRWYSFTGIVEGFPVAIKGYGTWLQVLRVNSVQHESTMYDNVTDFKNRIDYAIEYALKHKPGEA
jgi:hypothetical protein